MPTAAEITAQLANTTHHGLSVPVLQSAANGWYVWSASTGTTTTDAYMMYGVGNGGSSGTWYNAPGSAGYPKTYTSTSTYCVRVPNGGVSLYTY